MAYNKALRATPWQNALRAGLLLPLLGGCSLWDDWFGLEKTPLPGTRVTVLTAAGDLQTAKPGALKIALPAPAANGDWPQAGGTPAHVMEHPALRDSVTQAWSSSIGAGGGYRRKVTAQPVVAGGLVFTMDSDGVVAAFDAKTGGQAWRMVTQSDTDRSTNVGGGVAFADGVLYAVTGRADALALDAGTGAVKWRVKLPSPARAAPTVAAERVFVPLLDNQLVALSVAKGDSTWSYQGRSAEPMVLGLPAPAYGDGLLLGGFGAGELVALNPVSGAVIWVDSLAASRGRNSLADVSTILGRTAIKSGRAFAVSMGQQLAAVDLRSGRRLWERNVASPESPWIAGDWMFLVTAGNQVAAFSLVDGQAAWATQLDVYENVEKKKDPIRWFGPVLAGDRLILAGTNRVAVSISPYTGQILGTERLPGPASVTPVVTGGTLYIVTDDGSLVAYR
ncbi:MAG: PQQ-binding-like beta-propeller repeat protein [Alphaproteobacteria bacterium]|nr:PQQ-binding-like beta-propeller repeat protein [Alphaproteobacteria bacterium]